MSRKQSASLDYTERLVSDFAFFMTELYAERKPDWVIGPIERDICEWTQHGPRQRGVLAHRSFGKTCQVTCGYTCWRLLRDPSTKILIVSKSGEHAKKAIGLAREWIRSVSFLRHLDPAGDKLRSDSTHQFDVAGCALDALNPSVLAKGVEGQITGTHADVVIGDDVETPENTKTVTARLELRGKVKEFKSISTMGGRDIIYVGTIHHPLESLYPHLSRLGYAFRTWPLTIPQPQEKFIGLAPIIDKMVSAGAKPGDTVCPYRFDSDYIIDQKKEGELHWKLQCQCVCNTATTHRHPLKISDLIVFPVQRDKAPTSIAWGTSNDRGGSTALEIPICGLEGSMLYGPIMFDTEWAPYTGTKAWIDPAGRGTDMTGFAAVGHLAGKLWAKCIKGLPGGMESERLDELALLLREHGVRDCYVETNIDVFNTYTPLLEDAIRRRFVEPDTDASYPEGWKCSLTPRHSTGQKELRIIKALEPVISGHRLIIHPDALIPKPDEPLDNELQWQMAALTHERGCLKEDGKVDALAGVVKEWMDVLRLDPISAAVNARQRSVEDRLAEHRREVEAQQGYYHRPVVPRFFKR